MTPILRTRKLRLRWKQVTCLRLHWDSNVGVSSPRLAFCCPGGNQTEQEAIDPPYFSQSTLSWAPCRGSQPSARLSSWPGPGATTTTSSFFLLRFNLQQSHRDVIDPQQGENLCVLVYMCACMYTCANDLWNHRQPLAFSLPTLPPLCHHPSSSHPLGNGCFLLWGKHGWASQEKS